MMKIINGKRYNTETAERLAYLPSKGMSRSDFTYQETSIYRTKNGRFFLAGHGGPMTRWAQPSGPGGRVSGEGIQPVSEEEARDLLEHSARANGGDSAATDALERYFDIEEA